MSTSMSMNAIRPSLQPDEFLTSTPIQSTQFKQSPYGKSSGQEEFDRNGRSRNSISKRYNETKGSLTVWKPAQLKQRTASNLFSPTRQGNSPMRRKFNVY